MSIAKQKLNDLLAQPSHVLLDRLPRADQITQRLLLGFGHCDHSQSARSKLPPQLGCIAPIGLDLLARLSWRERRRRHLAVHPRCLQTTVLLEPARTRLVHHPNFALESLQI